MAMATPDTSENAIELTTADRSPHDEPPGFGIDRRKLLQTSLQTSWNPLL
jgi:hypothetical protein